MSVEPLRLQCSVPFCRHTRGQRKGEPPIAEGERWLCGEHWKTVPAESRRALRNIQRAYRKRFGENGWWTYPAGSSERTAAAELEHVIDGAWLTCERIAKDRAAGI